MRGAQRASKAPTKCTSRQEESELSYFYPFISEQNVQPQRPTSRLSNGGQARPACDRNVIPPSTASNSLSVRLMFRREVFTQISAQAVPKTQTAFSCQVSSDRGTAEKTRQFPARNPSAAITAANAPQIMANGRQTLPCGSQPQVHYADHRSAPVFGKTRKVRVSVEYDRVTCEPYPGKSFVTDDPMCRQGHVLCTKRLTIIQLNHPFVY